MTQVNEFNGCYLVDCQEDNIKMIKQCKDEKAVLSLLTKTSDSESFTVSRICFYGFGEKEVVEMGVSFRSGKLRLVEKLNKNQREYERMQEGVMI